MFDASLGRFLTPEEQEQEIQKLQDLVDSIPSTKALIAGIPGYPSDKVEEAIRSFDELDASLKKFLSFGTKE